jgi:uncharacterized protein YajQ (UPF0234 family)
MTRLYNKIMPSFDVISKINYPEFDNALANCLREITNRYDFKGLNISIERKDKTITTLAPDELKLKQVNELLQVHLIRRKVDPRVITVKNSESAAGTTIRQVSELKEGISQENAKKIIADVKKLKLKIQIKIQGEELRAEGKKRDDLQEAISAIQAIDIGLPIEFVNFRD